MAFLAWAVGSGGDAAWQPRAAARRMERVWPGRIAHLRWGKTGRIRALPSGGKQSQVLRACGAQDDMLARFGEGKENCRGAACCAPTHPGEQAKAWHPRLMSCPRLFARH